MKKHFVILICSCSLIFFSSCKQKKTEKQETVQVEQTVNEVRSLPDYAYTDSLMQGSHVVVYTITSQSDDELPAVVDEDGVTFKDSRWSLEIVKDGKPLFNRSFSKADFRNSLPGDFQKYGIMDGMRFNRSEEGKLYFNTCISLPDSDMSCPFILTIGPDGSYTIATDTSFEEDVPPTLESISN